MERWKLLAGISLVGLSVWPGFGCQNTERLLGIHRCAEIPPGAVPQPVGTYNCQWQTQQMERAEREDFVIHRSEWKGHSVELGPFGRRHLREIAGRLAHVPYPVIIAESEDPATDQARAQAVIEHLAGLGVMVDPERIQVGQGLAEPLYGIDAPGVASQYVRAGGAGRGAGGGGGGGGASSAAAIGGAIGGGGGFGGGGARGMQMY